jgi:hypothetical protein
VVVVVVIIGDSGVRLKITLLAHPSRHFNRAHFSFL